jgi:hypothetical protein
MEASTEIIGFPVVPSGTFARFHSMVADSAAPKDGVIEFVTVYFSKILKECDPDLFELRVYEMYPDKTNAILVNRLKFQPDCNSVAKQKVPIVASVLNRTIKKGIIWIP